MKPMMQKNYLYEIREKEEEERGWGIGEEDLE